MTSIGLTGTLSYQTLLASAQRFTQSGRGSATTTTPEGSSSSAGTTSATSLTLSAAARAALEERPLDAVLASARSALDAALTSSGGTTLLNASGGLAANLSALDRRELWAVSSNSDGSFTDDEQQAAALEMAARFDSAMAGPTAVARVTGAIKGLYIAALGWLDASGPEQRASTAYADHRAALLSGLDQLATDPSRLPDDNPDDLVIAYMDRLASGEVRGQRDIAAVATDARAALDAQSAAATAAGTRLVYNSVSGKGQRVDLSGFDTRTLSAIALNTGSQFSDDEQRVARGELRLRQGAEILAGLRQASSTSDPADFASSLISLYGGMSAEERNAAGWSADFYKSVVANYQSAVKVGSLLGQSPSTSGAAASTGTSTSLLDYL